MTTREIALRCAAAMDPNLLRHRWPENENARERYSLTKRQYRTNGVALLRQLEHCKNDEARRLILGLSR